MALTAAVTTTALLRNYGSNASLISYTGSNPAANAEFSETVPTGKGWYLFSVSVPLATGAGAPLPSLVLDDGTNVLWQSAVQGAQGASTTFQYTWAIGFPTASSGGTTATGNLVNGGPMPFGIPLGPGYRVRSITSGIAGAGVDYAAPSLLVLEWLI